MPQKESTLILRYESTAKYHDKVAKREWAYAKNTDDGYHYGRAREHYRRAAENRAKAEALKNKQGNK
ncbi:hypothetical protein [Selenomonas ruminantium]|uniref:hypothetical protein n=1 Tax=Selenomonas ruminantium TaxID=971 RepID=UPI0026F15767|nr:hypothetical protein [Selenomonas ruminantium]